MQGEWKQYNMKYTKELLKENKDINKAEIFKKYYWDLVKKHKAQKAEQFKEFIYKYFERKGKKSEYVFIMEWSCKSVYELTDEIMMKY